MTWCLPLADLRSAILYWIKQPPANVIPDPDRVFRRALANVFGFYDVRCSSKPTVYGSSIELRMTRWCLALADLRSAILYWKKQPPTNVIPDPDRVSRTALANVFRFLPRAE